MVDHGTGKVQNRQSTRSRGMPATIRCILRTPVARRTSRSAMFTANMLREASSRSAALMKYSTVEPWEIPARSVELFGSVATGTSTADSDVELMVYRPSLADDAVGLWDSQVVELRMAVERSEMLKTRLGHGLQRFDPGSPQNDGGLKVSSDQVLVMGLVIPRNDLQGLDHMAIPRQVRYATRARVVPMDAGQVMARLLPQR